MNCPNCNNPLVPNARFCPGCGSSRPVAGAFSVSQESPEPPPLPPWSVTTQPVQPHFPPPPQQSSQKPSSWVPQLAQSTTSAPIPPRQAQSRQTQKPGAPVTPPKRAHKKRTWGGCLLRVSATLVVLLALLIGSWFALIRPALHSTAERQLGDILSSSLDRVDPLFTAFVPAGLPLPVPASAISQALVAPTSIWFTIQNMQLSITPMSINVTFQVQIAAFTFFCGIDAVPEVAGGRVDIKSLTVIGPIDIVMSPDEMKMEVNLYLSKLHDRINRPINALTLTTGFILVTLG